MKQHIRKLMQSLDPRGRLYGFCGWLTTQDVPTVMSSSAECGNIASKIGKFMDANDIPRPKDGWDKQLVHPKGKLRQSFKQYVKRILLQYVTPNMIYDMYFADGLQGQVKAKTNKKDSQLDFIQSYILKKLKGQYLKQLQYRLLRQGRYFFDATVLSKMGQTQFFIAILNKQQRPRGKTMIERSGYDQLIKFLIAINQIYNWDKLKQNIQTIHRVRQKYIQKFSSEESKNRIREQRFGQMLTYFMKQDVLPPDATVSDLDITFRGNTFQTMWRDIKRMLSERQMKRFLYQAQNIGYHAQQLYKADYSRFMDIYGDKFRKDPLSKVRKYYNNPKVQVTDFINLFNDIPWLGDFGGKPWYYIGTQYIKLRQTQGRQQLKQLLDHINDLVHNTGSVLNKFKNAQRVLKALNVKKNAQHIDRLYKYIDDPDLKQKFKEYYPLIQKSNVRDFVKDQIVIVDGYYDKILSVSRGRYQTNSGSFESDQIKGAGDIAFSLIDTKKQFPLRRLVRPKGKLYTGQVVGYKTSHLPNKEPPSIIVHVMFIEKYSGLKSLPNVPVPYVRTSLQLVSLPGKKKWGQVPQQEYQRPKQQVAPQYMPKQTPMDDVPEQQKINVGDQVEPWGPEYGPGGKVISIDPNGWLTIKKNDGEQSTVNPRRFKKSRRIY